MDPSRRTCGDSDRFWGRKGDGGREGEPRSRATAQGDLLAEHLSRLFFMFRDRSEVLGKRRGEMEGDPEPRPFLRSGEGMAEDGEVERVPPPLLRFLGCLDLDLLRDGGDLERRGEGESLPRTVGGHAKGGTHGLPHENLSERTPRRSPQRKPRQVGSSSGHTPQGPGKGAEQLSPSRKPSKSPCGLPREE
eukprot:RCo011660